MLVAAVRAGAEGTGRGSRAACPERDEAAGAAEASAADAVASLRRQLETLCRDVAEGEVTGRDTQSRLQACLALAYRLDSAPAQDGRHALSEQRAALAALLTPREREVVAAVTRHGTTALAAHALGVSESAVAKHRANVLRKLGAASFVQVVRLIGG